MKRIVAVVLFLMVILGSESVFANPDMGGKFKLGTQLLAFDYSKTTTEYEGEKDDTKQKQFSIGATGLGVSAGYTITPWIEVGGNLLFQYLSLESGGSEQTMTNFRLFPYFQGNIWVSDSVFVPLQIGVGYGMTKGEAKYADETATTTTNLFIIEGGPGISFLPIDFASIDFMLRFVYGTGKIKQEYDGESIKIDESIFQIVGSVGLTLWI